MSVYIVEWFNTLNSSPQVEQGAVGTTPPKIDALLAGAFLGLTDFFRILLATNLLSQLTHTEF